MEERRLLLAIALSLLVLTGYSLLFSPRRPPPEDVDRATPATEPTAPIAPTIAPPAPASPPPEPAERSSPVPRVVAAEEKRVEVVAADYTVAFTNRGARLLSWTLGEYTDARGRPEEMVPALTPGVRPLDLETGEPSLDQRLREALFVPSTDTLRLAEGASGELVFRYAEGDIEADKALRFEGQTGLVSVSAGVRRAGEPVSCRLTWGPGLGNPTESDKGGQFYTEPQGVALVGGDVERFPAGKLGPEGRELRGVRWVGIESQYFAALFLPALPPDGQTVARIRPVSLPAEGGNEPAVAAVAEVAAGGEVRLYVGPKDYTGLERLGHQLERVVPVGEWIGPIAVILMRLLRWVHGHVGNWGWAIVILTVLINMVMAPLRHYSIANGLRMAKMSPEMRAIQERYRKVPLMDPRRQQMQEEMAALYARHGMSMGTQMLVGCLPLLLTMPFLFAFYRVLTVSVELRGASFLWISDLSQKDPLYLTPVLMGVSMYAMQKMTPTAMDPAQQRIMMLMPVVLAGMFMAAPAGLNLYWLTANLWSILQQVVEMRLLRPAEAPSPKKEHRRR